MPTHASTSCSCNARRIRARCCPAFNAPRINWKRTTAVRQLHAGAASRTTPTAPFSHRRPTGSLADEWGPARRRRAAPVQRQLNNQIVRNLLVGVQLQRDSGNAVHASAPASTTTATSSSTIGPRASAATPSAAAAQWTLNLFIGYAIAFGRQRQRLPPGIDVIGGGGGRRTVQTVEQQRRTLPAAVVRAGAEPDQPRELHRLQRRPHVAVLRPADDRHRHAEDRRRHQLPVLMNSFEEVDWCSRHQ